MQRFLLVEDIVIVDGLKPSYIFHGTPFSEFKIIVLLSASLMRIL
jgi:hypothetical protein